MYSGARTIYHYSSRARQRRLESLADRLAMLAREVAVVTPQLPGAVQGRLRP